LIKMRRYSLTTRRLILAIASTLIASLGIATTAAQAIVVNDNGTNAGVSIVPGSRTDSLPGGVSAVTSASSCTDPWLASDLGGPALPNEALCYRGGAVMHKNETFALTWDQQRAYWSQTRGYVEQFLRDVADSSGSLGSPFAVTTQYNDAGGRAANASVFGGGCIDYGQVGNSSCNFGSPTGVGHDFPTSGCPVTGDSFVTPSAVIMNNACLTDAQLQNEVSTMVSQTGILGRTRPGYTPLVTLLLPPMVKTCLSAGGAFCSVNGDLTPPPPAVSSANTAAGKITAGTYHVEVTYDLSGNESAPSSSQTVTTVDSNSQNSQITISAPPVAPGETGWNAYVTGPNGLRYTLQNGSPTANNADLTLTQLTTGGAAPPDDMAYCSYHSQVNVGGVAVAYVVQPWSAGTACDEPDAPKIPDTPTPLQMAVGVGQRLVSPLSQAELAAIVNPGLNGWAGRDGTEIEDNEGCIPLGNQLDKVTLGASSQNPYFLQRESNNAGILEFDPVTYFGCAPVVDLGPAFVAPSAVNEGDVVQFDGSATDSTLIVPSQGYAWNFGDGTTATGPSIVHTYGKAGKYNVTLTVTDRGGNVNTLTQTIDVLGPDGEPVGAAPTTPAPNTGGGGSGGTTSGPALNVHLQMLPQSLKSVLRKGIAVRVTSNRAANGIATVWITRATAKRAHIKTGKAVAVRIGLGTVASVTNGTVTLRLHLSPTVAKKLRGLRHVSLTVRLALVSAGNHRLSIVAAGRY
jgi:PKD domain-containing protein